jgi:hypothetical protein
VEGAATRLAEPRWLTQHLAGRLYQQTGPDRSPLAGVQFASRHGDELALWAVFERASNTPTSNQLHDSISGPLDPYDDSPGPGERGRRPQQAAASPGNGKDTGSARVAVARVAQLPGARSCRAGRYKAGSSSRPEPVGTGPGTRPG